VSLLFLAQGGTAAAARWTFKQKATPVMSGAEAFASASTAAAHWALQQTPTPGEPGDSALFGVSCRSRVWCMAVGGPEGTNGHMIAELWNGRKWSLLRIPTPPRATASVLTAVRCTSTTDCVAVGAIWRKGPMSVLVEQWRNGIWTSEHAPTRSNWATSVLHAVSCPSRSSCFAVGEWDDHNGGAFPVLERLNGSAWSLRPAAGNRSALGPLLGVSCTSSSACMAVGVDSDNQGLAERWNGSSWVDEPGSNPNADEFSGLGAVSCASSTFCAAAGGGNEGGSDDIPDSSVQEVWNGANWSVKQDADPSYNINYDLYGISCASASSCLAVGDVAESWNGRAWSLEQTPTQGVLDDVSCPSTSTCFAVGVVPDRHYRGIPLAMRWSS
jgi:hypothetical protein